VISAKRAEEYFYRFCDLYQKMARRLDLWEDEPPEEKEPPPVGLPEALALYLNATPTGCEDPVTCNTRLRSLFGTKKINAIGGDGTTESKIRPREPSHEQEDRQE
jgi:hypothetical protein